METQRILLVEDNAVIALVIQEMLAEMDLPASISAAGTAEDGLKLALQDPFDVVITDHLLPGMTGLELIQNLVGKNPALRCILMTAFGSLELEREVRGLNNFWYMKKPFPLDDLRKTVREALSAGSGWAGKASVEDDTAPGDS